MAIKIFATLMGIFSIVFVFLGMQDFYSIDIKPYSLNFKNIEANQIKAYELNSSLVRTYYSADDWVRFEDRDIFQNVLMLDYDYNVSANKLVFMDKNISLSGNVLYKDINDTSISTERIFYLKDDKVIFTDTKFKAFRANDTLFGSSLKYDMKNKTLDIKGVNLWLD